MQDLFVLDQTQEPFDCLSTNNSTHLSYQHLNSYDMTLPSKASDLGLPETYNPAKLISSEIFWREHQKWFQDCGYMLRSRYMPDWKPSWPSNAPTGEYEDAQPLLVSPLHLLDLPVYLPFR
jgi:hypothetical protein